MIVCNSTLSTFNFPLLYMWGMAGVRLGDTSNRLVATGVPMSAVPQVSQFWSAGKEV